MIPAPVGAGKNTKSAAARINRRVSDNQRKSKITPEINSSVASAAGTIRLSGSQSKWNAAVFIWFYFPAIASISIPAPLGSALTAKQDLAGYSPLKKLW